MGAPENLLVRGLCEDSLRNVENLCIVTKNGTICFHGSLDIKVYGLLSFVKNIDQLVGPILQFKGEGSLTLHVPVMVTRSDIDTFQKISEQGIVSFEAELAEKYAVLGLRLTSNSVSVSDLGHVSWCIGEGKSMAMLFIVSMN